MNVYLILTAVFALFIVVDIVTAKWLKNKRTLKRNASLAALCVLAVAGGTWGGIRFVRDADATTKTLYHAYSYLLDGNMDKAVENAEKVQSPHGSMVLLLADCWRDNYASAFINADDLIAGGRLDDGLMVQAERIYALARQMTGLDSSPISDTDAHSQLTDIAEKSFAQLKISEQNEVAFLSGFQRDRMLAGDNYYEIDTQTLSAMLSETPNDKALLRYSVKYYNASGGLDMAEANAKKLLDADKTVENIVLYTDVIAQKLLQNLDIDSNGEGDKEIDALRMKAEEAEAAAARYDEGNPRRAENLAKAADYREQANGIKAKRIINWLIAQSPLFGDQSGVIDLQLSKLYAASGDEDKARAILVNLMGRSDTIAENSPIKAGLTQLKNVYYDTTATDDDMTAAISTLLRNDAFLPDAVLGRQYSAFLQNFLKYERVSIFISRVDATDYPTVRAYLNVNGQKDGQAGLANDFEISDFTFADNGFTIANKDVRRIEDDLNNLVSIALVIDGSGSMQGDRIANARRAVEACIDNLSPETQELSIVMYDDMVEVLSPLTNDLTKLRNGASGIVADGGTNIPVGLYGGIESLKDAVGTKAIILMTDGEDGNAGEMPNAIEAAQRENIAVFTVSTGGGNREYMENIAKQTGGSYMEAVTDAELVKVYTALQNFIVNNYCFAYTVTEDTGANPRLLTIGLADYEVSSSRSYTHSGLVMTKDGSFITCGESGSLRLRYAEPAVIAVQDAAIGVPVFISATGVTDGAQVFINGQAVKNVKTAGDSTITFVLTGQYDPGPLNVSVRLADGSATSTDKLIAISGTTNRGLSGQTIALGNNHTLYADQVEQVDDYTLKLSGNVVLDGLIRTNASVTLQANAPISSRGGRLVVNGGQVTGGGAAYVDFTAAKTADANYGQQAFGGQSMKVLDAFSFYFDAYTINLHYSGVYLHLPGFGEVYGEAQYDGTALTYTIYGGYSLSDLQANLNYALNGVPLPQNNLSNAVQMITGYAHQGQIGGYNGYGIYANTETMTVVVQKDDIRIVGSGTMGGYMGPIELAEGQIAIDTNNTDAMLTLTGTARFNNLPQSLKIEGQPPFKITTAGYYPDAVMLNATGLSINATGLSECFINGTPPKALDGAVTINYGLAVDQEPYSGQVGGLLPDIALACDRLAFTGATDRSQNALRAYHSASPENYVAITNNSTTIPIEGVEELSLFGSDLGGAISGTATINDYQIVLQLSVDGHLDNAYYKIAHDGKAHVSVTLPRNAYAGSIFEVKLFYDNQTFTYHASAMGGISPQDGFHTYAEGVNP